MRFMHLKIVQARGQRNIERLILRSASPREEFGQITCRRRRAMRGHRIDR